MTFLAALRSFAECFSFPESVDPGVHGRLPLARSRGRVDLPGSGRLERPDLRTDIAILDQRP